MSESKVTFAFEMVMFAVSISPLMMLQVSIPNEIFWLILNLLMHDSFNTFIVLSKTSKLFNKKISTYYLNYLRTDRMRFSLNCNEFAASGDLNLLAWMKNSCNNKSWSHNPTPSRKLEREHPESWSRDLNTSICKEAIFGGHFEILKWARENECSLDSEMYLFAAQVNRLDIILWLYKNDVVPHRDICITSAKYNNFVILKWGRSKQCRWHKNICYYAARNNNMEMLQWVKKKGCPWNARACSAAAKNGNLDMLMWLRSKNCPWNTWTCSSAAEGGHLNVLKWARENGCSWNEWTYRTAAFKGDFEFVKWIFENMEDDLLHLFSYVDHDVLIDDDVTHLLRRYEFSLDVIIEKRHMIILKYLIEYIKQFYKNNEYKNDNLYCYYAIRFNSIEILKWLMEENFKLPENPITLAAQYTCLDIVKILVEKGHKCNGEHYCIAASNYDSAMMQWLERHGCPIDKSIEGNWGYENDWW